MNLFVMKVLFQMSQNCSVETNGSLLHNYTMDDISSQQAEELIPNLLQVFLTILLGWLAGTYQIIPEQEAKGLNLFVGKFSLPVLIFVSLAKLNFINVEWSFLLAITISKGTIFVLVLAVDVLMNSQKDLSRAAIFAIFCTQTNDFGMGLPILDAVYGHDHPYVGLLYLAAPISLLILNPIGFLLLEAGQPSSNKITSKWRRVAQVWIKLFLNPIISMTILGVLANLTFQSKLPIIISKFLDALGAAFTSMAPFTLGLGIVGKIWNIRGDTLIPIVSLVFTKTMLSTFLTHFCVEKISLLFNGFEDSALSNFGFLYGTFPTALGVASYASLSSVNPDLISAAIVICTIVSAPLMYVSANVLTVLHTDMEQFLENLRSFQFTICMCSILCVVCVTPIFISKRYFKMPHTLTLTMLYFSLQTALGGSIWAIDTTGSNLFYYIEVKIYLFLLKIYSEFLGCSLCSWSLHLLY